MRLRRLLRAPFSTIRSPRCFCMVSISPMTLKQDGLAKTARARSTANTHPLFLPHVCTLTSHMLPPLLADTTAAYARATLCTSTTVPGYLEHQDKLEDAGIDEVIVYCVNDGAVMKAWAADQKINHASLLTFMGDPSSSLTKALGMELTHEGPIGKGLYNRCKRNALYVVDGVVKHVVISEADDDPAGDDRPEATCAPAMLELVSKE